MWQEALMSSPDFAKLLHLNGELMDGVSSADASTLLSLGSSSSKAICAVYSWIVLDVKEGEGTSNVTTAVTLDVNGIHGRMIDPEPAVLPLVLFAHYVEKDSAGRFGRGVSIRSGYATAYDGRGIFETEDTIYLLLGKGFRRPISKEAISLLTEGLVKEDYSVARQGRD